MKKFGISLAIIFSMLCFNSCGVLNTSDDVDNTNYLNTIEFDKIADSDSITDMTKQLKDMAENIDVQKLKEISDYVTKLTSDLSSNIDSVAVDVQNNVSEAKNYTYEDTVTYRFLVYDFDPLDYGMEVYTIKDEALTYIKLGECTNRRYFQRISTTDGVIKAYTKEDNVFYKKSLVSKDTKLDSVNPDIELFYSVISKIPVWTYKNITPISFVEAYNDTLNLDVFEYDDNEIGMLWSKDDSGKDILRLIHIRNKANDIDVNYFVNKVMSKDELTTFTNKF